MSTEQLSNKEILVRLLDRTENLPAIENSVDKIEEHLAQLNGKVADHEKRLRKEENQTSYMKGAVGLALLIGIPNIIQILSAL